MVIDFYNRNGGGGGTADYATSAGTSNSTKLLEGETNFPQSGNTGDVVAIGSTPTRGTKAPIPPSTGIYQYDGSVWNKIEGGEGGDNTVLKALSGAPATVEDGDVFAIHTPSADTQYEVSAWTNTEEYTINFDDYVQAIKVHIKTNGYFDFGFNNPDWHDGFGFTIEADGKYGYVFSTGYYDSSRWEVSEQSIKFIASDWMAKTGGKTLYLDIREDNGDYYLYIYTDDISKIWITDVAQNELEGEIQVGTVIPAHDAYDKTYQASNEEVVELAKVTDLPAENRLVPHFDQHDDSSKVLYIDYWSGPVWQPQTDLVRNVFATYDGLGNHKDSVLIAKDAYHFKWDYIDNIHPITALPAQSQKGIVFTTEDGIFHAGDEELDTTNLYEIENHNDWDNPTGGTHLIISGSASADRVGFKFEGLSDDFMLFWTGNEWNYEFFENVTQENGNFTGYTTGSTPIEVVVSYDGTSDVFEIVCGEPWTGVYAGNDWSDFTSRYFVANLPVTKYSKSVTSNSINSIVKLTQAEYDALVSGGTVDENTFYLIVADQPQPQAIGVWTDDGNGTYTFQMLDTDPASWDSAAQIGQLLGVNWPDAGSDPIDMNVYLRDNSGSWEITTNYTGGGLSDEPHYDFTDGTQDEWDTGLRTEKTSSDSNILVSWDGTDTFTFYSGDSDYPLSMTTIDPTAE